MAAEAANEHKTAEGRLMEADELADPLARVRAKERKVRG
jgi:hypothetical protein